MTIDGTHVLRVVHQWWIGRRYVRVLRREYRLRLHGADPRGDAIGACRRRAYELAWVMHTHDYACPEDVQRLHECIRALIMGPETMRSDTDHTETGGGTDDPR